jgi:hypothetical protein
MIVKFEIIGHIHNSPDRVRTHYQSNPQGLSEDELVDRVNSFQKAFNMKEVRFHYG